MFLSYFPTNLPTQSVYLYVCVCVFVWFLFVKLFLKIWKQILWGYLAISTNICFAISGLSLEAVGGGGGLIISLFLCSLLMVNLKEHVVFISLLLFTVVYKQNSFPSKIFVLLCLFLKSIKFLPCQPIQILLILSLFFSF